jgi:hypothetical protein
MRRHFRPSLYLVASLALAVAVACAPGEPAGSGAETDAATLPATFDTEANLAAWLELWATYDLDKVDELFLVDPPPTYFSSEKQGLIVGLDAIREHHAGFGFVPGGSQPTSELWLEEVHSELFGTTAVVNAIWYFGDRSAASPGGPGAVQRGPMTAVYVLDGDTYKIAHMSFSEYLAVAAEDTG